MSEEADDKLYKLSEALADLAYETRNPTDENGNPSGGLAQGPGFVIVWQNGAIAGPDAVGRNGAFLEDVLRVCLDRLQFHQETRFACSENNEAINGITQALGALQLRQERRQREGVAGTHQP